MEEVSPGSLSVPAGLTLGAAVRALGVSDFRIFFRRAKPGCVYQSVRRRWLCALIPPLASSPCQVAFAEVAGA